MTIQGVVLESLQRLLEKWSEKGWEWASLKIKVRLNAFGDERYSKS
ncbi:hypothetical protein MJ1HA_1046 [Metallosphaera sedula]|nr:hypothetical protein MJ1HA_1046 [Metallosphaera sedula]